MSAGEHRTSTATDTYLTTPRRARVIAAKLIVGGTLGAVFGIIAATTACGAAIVLYGTQDASFPTSNTEVWSTLVGAVIYATLYGFLGVAIGSLLRNQIAAIVGSLAWLLIIEQTLLSAIGDIAKWLPGAAGQAIVGTPDRTLLTATTGTLTLSAYCTVIALAAITITARRDT